MSENEKAEFSKIQGQSDYQTRRFLGSSSTEEESWRSFNLCPSIPGKCVQNVLTFWFLFGDFKECLCGLWINRTLGLHIAWRSHVQLQMKPCRETRSIPCWRHQRDTHFPSGDNWWPFDIALRTQFNKAQLTAYVIGENLCAYKQNTKQNDK